MTWNNANVLAVFLDCDIWVHHQYFFGNIHSFPVISPMGTSQSHDLEHCECTGHVPAGVITGKLSGKFKMYLQCSRWVHCWYTVHFLVMYLQCSWWEHHHLPPVRVECSTSLSSSSPSLSVTIVTKLVLVSLSASFFTLLRSTFVILSPSSLLSPYSPSAQTSTHTFAPICHLTAVSLHC